MKLLFLCAATAFAAAPPRIELDIAQAEKLAESIYRPHNDGLKQPNGDAVLSRQDYTERCSAGSSTFQTCPFPVAKAWDHQDKDISHRIVTRVYKVDQDGLTCGTTPLEGRGRCSENANWRKHQQVLVHSNRAIQRPAAAQAQLKCLKSDGPGELARK